MVDGLVATDELTSEDCRELIFSAAMKSEIEQLQQYIIAIPLAL